MLEKGRGPLVAVFACLDMWARGCASSTCIPAARRRGRPWGEAGLNLAQAWHQFDEIARAIAAVELFGENAIPTIFHRAI